MDSRTNSVQMTGSVTSSAPIERRQNWVLGTVLAVLLGGLVVAVGGPTWAVVLGLVAGMLVVVLTLGLRD